jgi:2',3'-cyclic-nucleotide 2'-phosphodiesterase (5'-nucleotidase family)
MNGIFGKRGAFWMNPNFPPPLGGAPSAATVIGEERERAKEEGAIFLLLDTGNSFGGNLIGENSEPEKALRFMNKMGYDIASLGVHDFVIGVEGLKKFVREADFPFVCSNIVFEGDTTKYPDFIKPYVIIEKGGVKFGIFGLISEYMPIYMLREKIEGLHFLKEIPTARRMVKELRERGADIIILLSHTGQDRELLIAREVKGIDVIIGGFDGRGFREPYEDPETHTVVVRTYGRLSDVGKLTLYYDRNYRILTGYEGELVTLLLEEIPPDPDIEKLLNISYK